MKDKYKIVKKAYCIDFTKIYEGYLYSAHIEYGETRDKAKSKLFDLMEYQEMKTAITFDEINYLNIPIKRCYELDIVIFEGCEVKRNVIDEIFKDRERSGRLDEMANNDDIKYCHKKKGAYYYRDNNYGYTEHIINAGVYEKMDAINEARSVRELIIVPVVSKESHNSMIENEIKRLQLRLIQ